jgi:hypothetical protein
MCVRRSLVVSQQVRVAVAVAATGAAAGRRLAGARGLRVVRADWPATGARLLGERRRRSAGGATAQIAFELAGGRVQCAVRDSHVVPPALAERLAAQGLIVLAGQCDDGSVVQLSGDVACADRLSASFATPGGDLVLVDSASAGSDSFLVYNFSDGAAAAAAARAAANCSTTSEVAGAGHVSLHGHGPRGSQGAPTGRVLRGLATDASASATRGYVFRLAMVANAQYGAFHGNTVPSVMHELVTLVSRVNGIYARELGVYLQLIEGAERLICLAGSSSCASGPLALANNISLMNQMSAFIARQGVRESEYDLGHGLSTGSGGRAILASLCGAGKAGGASGAPQPVADAFYTDLVAHEIGHQLAGLHSFRDCSADAQLMPESAVEPGSGSTIMSYAGVCGSKDLQSHSDPFFSSVNLEEMRSFVASVSSGNSSGGGGGAGSSGSSSGSAGSCGRVVETQRKRPLVQAPRRCVVPLGSRFQLRGSPDASWGAPISKGFFTWERVDRGAESYSNRAVGRFRNWRPRQGVTQRFFPSLFLTHFGLENASLAERLPTAARAMKFRFVQRAVAFAADATASVAPGPELLGDFGFADTEVLFDGSASPLAMGDLNVLVPFTQQRFQWKLGGSRQLAPSVEILVGVNPLAGLAQSAAGFDASRDEPLVSWYTLDRVPNTGEATVTVPQIAEMTELTVMVMIRSAGDEGCFFYDVRTNVRLASEVGAPNAVPKEGPLPTPSPQPSAAATGDAAAIAVLLIGSIIALIATWRLFRRRAALAASHARFQEFKLRRKGAPDETLHSKPQEPQEARSHEQDEDGRDPQRCDQADQEPAEQHDEQQHNVAVNPLRAHDIAGFAERLEAVRERSKHERERESEVKPEASTRTRKEFAPSSPQQTDGPRSCESARRSLERPQSSPRMQALQNAEAPGAAIADFLHALSRLSLTVTAGADKRATPADGTTA